jgi:hypothetical protein
MRSSFLTAVMDSDQNEVLMVQLGNVRNIYKLAQTLYATTLTIPV